MILLSGFLDVLFRALIFVGLALSIGGVVFRFVALNPLNPQSTACERALRRSASLIAYGALLVAVSQIAAMMVALSALADSAGAWPTDAFISTSFARAGLLRAALALCLGTIAVYLRYRPHDIYFWGAAAFVSALVITSGAWLTHGASRLNNATALMSVTVIHQLAALVWIGGVIHLIAQWRLLRPLPEGEQAWSRVLARFSPMALVSVDALAFAGLYLYWEYIRSIDGLVGTAYGTMLITKIILMLSILALGGLNFMAIRYWKQTQSGELMLSRVPPFAEIEAGIGVVILMAAAALTSQPPAIDVPNQQATPAEVLHVFAPKMPQLTLAPISQMNAGASSSLNLYALPTSLQKLQSNFNHNVSGIFVIIIGLAAFTNSFTRTKWSRQWPLLFLPFAAFLFIFEEPTGWPLGKEGFIHTLYAPDVLQHRLATLVVVLLGFFEWRVQASGLRSTRWAYVFPVLCGIGGALLLTHSHSIFALKQTFLIEASHNAIGILAVLAGAAGWLELRMSGRESRIAGLMWPIFFILIGVVLLFYKES